MSIRNTLQLSAGITVLFIFLIIITVAIATMKINDAIFKTRSADAIVKEAFDLNAFTDEYLVHPSDRIVTQWKATHANIDRLLESQGTPDTTSENYFLSALKENNESIEINFNNIIAESAAPQSSMLRERQAAQLKIKSQAIVADATKLAALNFKEQEAIRIFIANIIILLTLLFSGIIIFTIILLYRRIMEPLAKLHYGTDKIAEGDLSYKLDIPEQDEFGQVARSFNKMSHRLQDLYCNLDKKALTAEEVIKAQKEFIAVLSHELRNPLAVLSNAVEILKLENTTGEESLAAMQRQTQIMRRLLDDLLEVSRVTQNKIILKKEVSDLRTIAREAIAANRSENVKKHQTVELATSTSPVNALVDPIRIAQVFSNILDNATKFTHEGGLIQVKVDFRDSNAAISIKDNGAGIRPEDTNLIFEAFVQTENTVAKGRGIGLGLKVARTLTELHGGEITVKSVGIGQGTEFTILLPLFTGDQTHATNPKKNPLSFSDSTCLVVDDEKDVADSFSKLLEMLGQKTHIAYGSEDALNILKNIRPDVMFIDIKMPGLDGYGLIEQIRKNSRLDNATLIAVTGYGQPEDKKRSKTAGFDHHMTKPIDMNELKKILSEIKKI